MLSFKRIVQYGWLLFLMGTQSARAQFVTADEARVVTENWIDVLIHNKGSWGGSPVAEVADQFDFGRGDRLLGYYFRVKPSGYIIVSLRRELPPIKAFSFDGHAGPDAPGGLTEVFRLQMEGQLDQIEKRAGDVATVSSAAVEPLLDIDYRDVWEELYSSPQRLYRSSSSDRSGFTYVPGTCLLSTAWHQRPPYNAYCPDQGCGGPSPDTTYEDNTRVGCIATAAAQIMRHWNWPPFGQGTDYDDTYDWPNMNLDSIIWDDSDDRFEDYDGNPISSDQLRAIAELCEEIGQACGMNYGCDESWAYPFDNAGADMLDAYENQFRYGDEADPEARFPGHDAEGWFQIIKNNININRPIQYQIQVGWLWEGHSLVLDGWDDEGGMRWIHANYGWIDSENGWYVVDGLVESETYMTESMIRKIHPDQAIGSWLEPNYTFHPTFWYRYIDQNCTGDDSYFEAGQYLQFLPGVEMKCTSPDGGKISIVGWSNNTTKMYAGPDTTCGVHIVSGHMYIYENGAISLK